MHQLTFCICSSKQVQALESCLDLLSIQGVAHAAMLQHCRFVVNYCLLMQDEPECCVNDKWEEDDSRGGQGIYQVEEANRDHLQQFAQD